jgi:SAM-dependent methyltransferase
VYAESARVYDLLMAGKDYGAVAARLAAVFGAHRPDARTLLDVGCGTGRHLEAFARKYAVSGIDLSERMLEIARTRCPDADLRQGDLRDFDFGRRFDLVTCLFGSLGYALDAAQLRAAAARLAAHVAPGGLVVVEPWLAPERFEAGRLVFDHVDEGPLRVARMYVARREGERSIYDIQYLVGSAAGIDTFDERQELGLHTDAAYRAAFAAAGLRVIECDATGFGYGLYLATPIAA